MPRPELGVEYTGKRSPAGWEAARVLYWKGVPPRVIARVGDGRNVGALGFGASCGSEAAISLRVLAVRGRGGESGTYGGVCSVAYCCAAASVSGTGGGGCTRLTLYVSSRE